MPPFDTRYTNASPETFDSKSRNAYLTAVDCPCPVRAISVNEGAAVGALPLCPSSWFGVPDGGTAVSDGGTAVPDGGMAVPVFGLLVGVMSCSLEL